MERSLTNISLCSGIGGLDLAAETAGIVTVAQVEIADYPTLILEKHWPEVPKWRDIHDFNGESFYDRTGLRTVDIVTGSLPCQPFSIAGKKKGKDDERYLWPEMYRIIREIQPAWVVFENVAHFRDMALDTVLSDLESGNYSSQAFIIPACAVDAPHKRERLCVVAHTNDGRSAMRRDWQLQDASKDGGERLDNRRRAQKPITGERWEDKPGTFGMVDGLRAPLHGRTVADSDSLDVQKRTIETGLETKFTNCSSRERERERGLSRESSRISGTHSAWEDWPDEPGIMRVVDGVPHRADRIKALGGAVVPQQFYPFYYYIVEYEKQGGM